MKFEFNSLQELAQFIDFVNRDKDSLIKEASRELKNETNKLSNAIKQDNKETK